MIQLPCLLVLATIIGLANVKTTSLRLEEVRLVTSHPSEVKSDEVEWETSAGGGLHPHHHHHHHHLRRHLEQNSSAWNSNATPTEFNQTKVREAEVDSRQLSFAQVNLMEGPHICGASKCLYRLKVDPNNMGYVAVGQQTTTNRTYKTLWQAYNLSQIISEQYQMQHVYLKPPQTISVSSKFRMWLDGNKTNDMRRKVMPQFVVLDSQQQQQQQQQQQSVMVQMVEIVGDNNTALFWGANTQKLSSWQKIDGWLEQLFLQQQDAQVRNVTLNAFQQDVQKLYALLQDHRCLWFDFQIFIRNDGHIVHLDLDRCYDHGSLRLYRAKLLELKQHLFALVDYVTRALETGTLPDSVSQEDYEAAQILERHRTRQRRAKQRAARAARETKGRLNQW